MHAANLIKLFRERSTQHDRSKKNIFATVAQHMPDSTIATSHSPPLRTHSSQRTPYPLNSQHPHITNTKDNGTP
ncbi:hypothetical protein IAQ61_007954 [Plenodomus lingam]|uniref:uncharacterized protein n=1 Tax=Leptosphaeria maculans TaxID=5022 RepID=UPI00332856EB|nr:hypothetical protein IAQ61_007954 [Plenodomus lingam]